MGKRTALIIGTVFFLFPFFTLTHIFKDLEVKEKGKIVTVKIISIPADCIGSRRTNLHFKFEYKGRSYGKTIGTSFCQKHEIGDKIEMLHYEKYEN
ncbi:MAG: hypothetical protein H7Y04_15455, partial [Verrucomicrobia bacterium]|nr:hypothetical protein [Cytophagales bacterium]